MTIRAIILGLLSAMALCAFGYFNDWVLKQTFVASDLVPVSVFGLLLVVLLGVNPLLQWLGRRPFRGGELAVALSLLLMACSILGPGLMWGFTNVLAMPHYYNQLEPGWRRLHLLEYVPPVMLIDASQDPQASVTGFCIGLSPQGTMGLGDIPWIAWARTLWFWLPLLSLGLVATVCSALIVHRQWSTRERLRYPIALFASQVMEGAGGQSPPAIFRNGKFWVGAAVSGGVLLVNGLAYWYPQGISIPLRLETWPALMDKWPWLKDVPNIQQYLTPSLFFIAVGLAYFVDADVSFSVGIAPLAYLVLYVVLYRMGITLSAGYFEPSPQNTLLAGAYIGTALAILYMGRRFYLAVLAGAIGLAAREGTQGWMHWACRIALACAAGMVAILHLATGLGWAWAVLFVLLAGLLFLVVTRIVVETGLFIVQPNWHPVMVASMLGMGSLSTSGLIILALLSSVVTVDPRVCLMPMAANALKIGEQEGVGPQRLGKWLVLAAVVSLAVALTATLYIQYRYGALAMYPWANEAVKLPFNMLSRAVTGAQTAWEGPLAMGHSAGVGLRASWACLGAGLVLAVGCRTLRLRYVWWPIHPVLFLVWGTFPINIYAPSLLLCWAIKTVICRLGGAKTYHAFKPLFVGLVAGELLAALVWAVAGYAHYAVTGFPGPYPPFMTHY